MKKAQKTDIKNLELRHYLYLDEKGIDSIYNQLTETVILEERIQDTNTKNIKSKVGLGCKIKRLFGLDASLEKNTQTTQLHERHISYSSEQKITKIIEMTSMLDCYCTDLEDAKEKCLNSTSLILINFSDTFWSRQDFTNPDSSEYVKKCGYLEFERGDLAITKESLIKYKTPFDLYTYSDEYYKKCRYRVVMSMSLDKLQTSLESRSSHFSVALRASQGKICLGVFGQIRNINNLYFQIKPFAVWW